MRFKLKPCGPIVRPFLCGVVILLFIFLQTGFSSADVIARSNAELGSAITAAKGGDTIFLDFGGDSLDLRVHDNPMVSPAIRILSKDTLNPAKIRLLDLKGAQNLSFENLEFASDLETDRNLQNSDIHIERCKSITIKNSTMKGVVKGTHSERKFTQNSRNLMAIRWSDNITIENNKIASYLFGIGVLETTHLSIIGNDISGIQGDGIRMGGVSDVLISSNYIHDFATDGQNLNHADMIQLWSVNTTIKSHNIQISDNRLLSGFGNATQSIFLRNDKADRDPSTEVEFYSDITIRNNLIQNSHLHGITVGETNNVEVSNNTLLFNPQSHYGTGEHEVPFPKDFRVYLPSINIAKRAHNVQIRNNVATSIGAGGDARAEHFAFALEGR